MLKLGKICILFLAVGVMTATSIPALAEEKKSGAEIFIFGDTTLSIVEVRQNPRNVSFTVPLYVTMAVIEGETKVKMPDAYTITNTSAAVKDPGVLPFDIAVTKMTFEKMAGSSYNTVTGPDISMGEIMFQVGGLTMPALNQAGSKDVELRAVGSQFLEHSKLDNYKDSPLKKIQTATPDNALRLELKGTVSNKDMLSEQSPVAQFQVAYIITPLIGDVPLQNVYAGDDNEQAGSPVMPDR